MKTLQLIALVTTVSMNLSFSQSTIKVWGSDDSLTVVAQIERCLYHLDIFEPIRLDVFFNKDVPEDFKGVTIAYDVPDIDTRFFQIRVNARMNSSTQRLVLAHEMLHVKQYIKQGLEVVGQQQAKWKGKTYNIKGLHHRQTPWERDALRNDNRLAKLLKDPTSAPLTASKDQQ